MINILGEFKSQDWLALIKQLDTDNDGRIDYGEFVTAAINRKNLLTTINLELALKMLDLDGNGFVSVDELKQVFAGANQLPGADEMWDEIMREVDTNRDGLISHDEFLSEMLAVLQQRTSQL